MEHGNWSASQQPQKHPHGGLGQDEKAKESPCWGYVSTADEDQSTQNFYSTDSALDIAKDWLLHLHSPSEEAQTTLDERKVEINQTETFVCTCLGSGFSVSEQVFDLLMNSSQTYGT